jgi:hypothetical protein
MRYELIDREWAAIRPMLPNNLVGIFWVLRSGVPWRYLPKEFGPYTTCYNRFVRWRRARAYGAGSWPRLPPPMMRLCIRYVNCSIHQHAACIAGNRRQSMGRSRGGLTSMRWSIETACRSGSRLRPEKRMTTGSAFKLLSRLKSETMLLADRGYDANWIRALAAERGICWGC